MAKRCVFCGILSGESPASIVFRDELVCAFMDIQPVNPGHLLVVPLVHAERLAELPPETAGRMLQAAGRLTGALREVGLRCEGVNLFLADGEAAGQEVPHAHLHVFPRYAGDGFGLRLGPHYHERPPRSELDEIAARIRRALK